MKTIILICLAFLFFVSFNQTTHAQQDTTKTVRIELKDGSILVGKIVYEGLDSLSFKTISNIETIIPKDQIVIRSIISGKHVDGEIWGDDPNYTRLFFAPTGKALKAGQGYFSAYEIFFPFFAVGVTDFFTFAGGFSLLPGADEQVLYIAPKITPYKTEKFAISGGVLFLNIPEENSGAGIVYGVSTFDYTDASVTAGLGFGFSGGDFAEKPVLVLGWETRTSKSLKLISENWIFFGGDTHLISFGLRFFGKNLAADFGLVYPLGADTDGFPFFPWLGFAYNF